VDEKVKTSKVRRFKLLSAELVASHVVWSSTSHQPTVAFSQVGNFHIKASFVSIFFSFGIFEAIFCVK